MKWDRDLNRIGGTVINLLLVKESTVHIKLMLSENLQNLP